MEETKKHVNINNINSMTNILRIVEFLNFLGLLILCSILIYQVKMFQDFFTIIYMIPIIINLVIIRVFKKGFESITFLFAYLLHDINELKNKTNINNE